MSGWEIAKWNNWWVVYGPGHLRGCEFAAICETKKEAKAALQRQRNYWSRVSSNIPTEERQQP